MFVFCVVFAFGSLCFGFCSLERDKGIGLCIGPLPVYFCGPTARPLRELIINLICNMLGNMLNNLAEAIRRWTEKSSKNYFFFPSDLADRTRHGPYNCVSGEKQ